MKDKKDKDKDKDKDNSDDKSFADTLKYYREKSNTSKNEVCKLLGIHLEYLELLEHEHHSKEIFIPNENFKKLGVLLGLEYTDVLKLIKAKANHNKKVTLILHEDLISPIKKQFALNLYTFWNYLEDDQILLLDALLESICSQKDNDNNPIGLPKFQTDMFKYYLDLQMRNKLKKDE